ncbi:DNA replication and repair protein RecN [Sporobacter termitidis DSM 10068]|uniref:DNA repair protein RecN n=1 Tax=Sporobacter termitidis DSM 10068 TaxID=1123282 RepID=A0A1M5Y835_9FIRM|nr:DNA repair protein RecN [Sporobacter termitidis]SHI08089.1 DNA replication and repair protein RecN [Sporobacter termitidis DSM 10068]
MIQLLHIENIAVIEKSDITFGPGLNVLTGETGAGKSIVIDALTAVTGGRASRELVRTGAAGASVTAVFAEVQVSAWCEENGIEPDEDGKLFLMRKITSDGKNSCRVNGCPVSVGQLRELGGLLIDIHGQNDGRKLLDESAHRGYLDAFGRLADDVARYAEAYKALRDKQGDIEKLSLDESEKERRIDNLKFQLDELDKADIRPGEIAEKTARRDLLKNASRLTEALDDALEAMYGGDSTEGAVTLIGQAEAQATGAARYAESLSATAEKLKDLLYAAEDATEELRDLRASLDFSPDELDSLETRLDQLRRLMKKYGGSEDELIAYREKCRGALDEIEYSSDRLAKLEKELEALKADAQKKAAALSEKRKKAAKTLEERIRAELSDLSMAGVRFKVEFEDVRAEFGLNGAGCDEVRFLMSANAGEAPGRISHIASGGELSRIMLALKNVLTENGDVGTMVFDEVDAGVSGIAAQRVGEKLSALSENRQVLCVTHLPQIAVMADTHFEIEKTTADGRTFTNVAELDLEGRKSELARLIGGANVTETTLLSAAEQLKAAAEYKAKRR